VSTDAGVLRVFGFGIRTAAREQSRSGEQRLKPNGRSGLS
jgi:hypothetical protein